MGEHWEYGERLTLVVRMTLNYCMTENQEYRNFKLLMISIKRTLIIIYFLIFNLSFLFDLYFLLIALLFCILFKEILPNLSSWIYSMFTNIYLWTMTAFTFNTFNFICLYWLNTVTHFLVHKTIDDKSFYYLNCSHNYEISEAIDNHSSFCSYISHIYKY